MFKNFLVSYLILNVFDNLWYSKGPLPLMISKIQLKFTSHKLIFMLIYNFILSLILIKLVLPNIRKNNIYLDCFKYSIITSIVIFGSSSLRISTLLDEYIYFYEIFFGFFSVFFTLFITKKIEILLKGII